MARSKSMRPEVARNQTYLAGVAKNLIDKVYGSDGPPWGTTFADLEELAVQLGRGISRELLNQALERQSAGATPAAEGLCPTCGKPAATADPEPRIVTTRIGDAEWNEPQRHCRHCRRSFFPSDQEFGDRSFGAVAGGAGEGRVRRRDVRVV